ncbi:MULTISPECIES: DUF3846 domain-containing protein [Agrobacterium]|uniref:DUF3846 domain-containing protein n=1 Tax=Agrobacterium TaxID=357 RepID=UPI0009BA36EA|nr:MULTISPECIES: protein psiB [Agrobacterium]QCL77406.1 protein psiB [Agrobacterium tumefaciens]CUX72170.1 conserved hypothetical protein [Agrobacterium sp. NCPPB 925]
MTKTATVYLLDPKAATIEAVEIEARSAFAQTYTLIGCELVQVIPFDTFHSLVTDEEGLRDGLTEFSIFKRYPQPLAGKIVLMGADFAAPQISLEDAAMAFQCCKPVLDPVFADMDDNAAAGLILAGALVGMQTRIERHTPTVIKRGN